MTQIRIDLNFDAWLRCQGAREDFIGSFARAAENDPLFPSGANHRDYIDYFSTQGILSWVSEGFDAAWEEYASLRFASDVLLSRMSHTVWSAMFPNVGDYIISSDEAIHEATAEIDRAVSDLGGKTLPRMYGFSPGETFVFPDYVSTTADYQSVSVDIEFDRYPNGLDMEIVRAMADAISARTQFCARYEESDILEGQNIEPGEEAA